MKRCTVCHDRARAGLVFCLECESLYDRMRKREHTIAGLIAWTAKRARKCERARAARASGKGTKR